MAGWWSRRGKDGRALAPSPVDDDIPAEPATVVWSEPSGARSPAGPGRAASDGYAPSSVDRDETLPRPTTPGGLPVDEESAPRPTTPGGGLRVDDEDDESAPRPTTPGGLRADDESAPFDEPVPRHAADSPTESLAEPGLSSDEPAEDEPSDPAPDAPSQTESPVRGTHTEPLVHGTQTEPSVHGTPTEPPDLQPSVTSKGNESMSQLDQALSELLAIDGASGAAIVDLGSGMALAHGGNPGFSLEVAAAGNSNVVRAKMNTMRDLGVQDQIDDILITLGHQYHLINVLKDEENKGLFIYLVLNRTSANLALARHKLGVVARKVRV